MDKTHLDKKIRPPDKKNKAKKILLVFLKNIVITVVIIIFLVFSFGYYFLLGPKFKEIKAIEDIDLKEQEFKYQQKEAELAGINKTKNEYRAVSPADLEKINFLFPDEPDQKELFGYIEKLISRNGYILPSLSISAGEPRGAAATAKMAPGNGISDKNIGIIKISFKIGGVNYSGLKSLLGQIENDLRIFDITNLNFDPDEKSLAVEMNTYYRL